MGERSLSLDATEFAHEVVLQRLPALRSHARGQHRAERVARREAEGSAYLPNRQVHVVVQFAVLVLETARSEPGIEHTTQRKGRARSLPESTPASILETAQAVSGPDNS